MGRGFNKLVAPPRSIPGGILFTIDEVSLGQTVIVGDEALDAVGLAPSKRDRVAFVMENIQRLAQAALEKKQPFAVPELIVLDASDIAAEADADAMVRDPKPSSRTPS